MIKTKKLLLGLSTTVLVFFVIGAWYVYNYLQIGESPISPGSRFDLQPLQERVTGNGAVNSADRESVDYEVVEVARGLFVPWSIVFTSAERIILTQRDGNVSQVVDGQLVSEPLVYISETVSGGEAGLMGMTLHPNYEQNRYVYICVTYSHDGQHTNKIERLIDRGNSLERDRIIIDNIPAARNHAGCRIKFGPDEKLYITTGDALERSLAQDLDSLAGKLLRINDDGSIPADNPFGNSPIYSYGHRNAQGLAWHSSGVLYSTEHGPSGFDGPGGGDEINIIYPGANYGWPVVSHDRSQEGMVDPVLVFTPAEAPAGAMFYSGSVFPQFADNFFFTALRGSGIIRVEVNPDNPEEVLAYEKLDIDFGRIRDIAESPDGLIYFVTSNRDGRGSVRDGDDKLLRLQPR